MGSSLSWLVARREEETALLEALQASTNPEEGELAFCMTRSPDGLIHLFEAGGRNWLFGFNNEERKRLSAGRRVWFCILEEHTMTSECCFWENETEIWGVCHDPEAGGVFHLEERGVLPSGYLMIRNAAIKKQEAEGGEDSGVDLVISVPMDLGELTTGYGGGDDGPQGEYMELYSKFVPPEPEIGPKLSILMNVMALGSRAVDLIRGRRN